MNRLLTFVLFVILLFCQFTYAERQISQFGITWTFDRDYTVGQFANGDYWALGPVTVVDITKPSNMSKRDGSMINPIPSKQHGYDGRVGGYNQNLDVSLLLPNLVVNPNESLISTISRKPTEIKRSKRRPALEVASVLTVLDKAPPEGSFRPPYSGSDKPIYSSKNLNTNLLLQLEPVASTPSLLSVEALFKRAWIDHVLEWQGDDLHPKRNLSNYGAGIARNSGIGALRLLLNDPIEDKELLLIRYVQLGIDNFGLVKNGANWGNVGGTIGVGRKIPIIFAGLMLDNSEIKNVASSYNTRSIFQEDGQTFYLTQSERDATYHPDNCKGDQYYCHPGYYDSTPLGTPEWGERHYKWLTTGYNYLPGKIGYLRTTHKSTIGAALTVHLLGLEELWNYDPFLDWTDRCRNEGITGTWGSVFAEEMWNAYRADYGPVWTMFPVLNIAATGGSVTKTPNKTAYTLGEKVILRAVAHDGYQFTGWSGGFSGTGNPVTIIMYGNRRVTANFAIRNNTQTHNSK